MLHTLAEIASRLDQARQTNQADRIDSLLYSVASQAEGVFPDLPIVCTVAIFRRNEGQLEILLETRLKSPDKGRYCLVGGHCEEIDGKQEDYTACAVRETKEETDITLYPQELIYVCERLRNAKKRKRDVLYTCIIPMERSKATAGSDAGEAFWAPIDQIPDLAWDHELFIEEALKKVLTVPANQTLDLTHLHLPVRTNQGRLIVFEGVDCAGKSSQVEALCKKLGQEGLDFVYTKWASSPVLKPSIKTYKQRTDLPELLYSLLNAADMEDRYFFKILPALAEGKTVVCDRYIYSSFARDLTRGVDANLLKACYKNFLKPDLIFYCRVKPETALERLQKEDRITYYGAGLDLHLKSDPNLNFLEYTKRCQGYYDQMFDEIDTVVRLDTSKEIANVSKIVWETTTALLKARPPRIHPKTTTLV